MSRPRADAGPPHPGRSREAIQTLLIALGFLLAVEGTFRALEALRLVRVAPESDPEWYELSESLGWRPRPGYAGTLYEAERRFDAAGLLVPDAAQLAEPGLRRIAIVGDSRAFGVGVPFEATFAERLDGLLPGTAVVNLALPGYSALQAVARFEEDGEALAPTLVIALASYNDRRYVPPGSEPDSRDAFSRHASRTARGELFSHLAAFRVLAPALRPRLPELDLADAVPRVAAPAHRDHWIALAERARAVGAATLLLSLGDAPAESAALRIGLDRRAAGDPRGSVRALSRAVEARNAFSDVARLELAKDLAQDPTTEARAAELRRVRPQLSLHGGAVIRPARDYALATRRAAKRAGALHVDLREELSAHPEVFFDFCHVDASGHERIALRLRDEICAAFPERFPEACGEG